MPGSTGPRTAKRTGAVPALAAALALLAALPYLAGGVSRTFLNLDDPEYVSRNARVLRGLTLDGARWAFTTFHAANWHPLTWLSHMLDVSLFGPAPYGHHLASVGLHALTAALLFVALRRLTGAQWPSAAVAALFGVHPLHVESVAWIAERKDVLSGLLFAATLLAYERYARRGGGVRLAAVTLLLGLGLLAKPMLVSVPFVLLLLDVWPLGRAPLPGRPGGASWAALVAEKLPLLALAAGSAALTWLAQRAVGAIIPVDAVGPADRVANAIVHCALYLRLTVWPAGLAVFHPVPVAGYAAGTVLGAALLLAGLTALAFAQFRRRPFLAVGWLWFLGMLVPVVGLVTIGAQEIAERYTYLPHVGLFLAAAHGAASLARGHAARRRAVAIGAVALTAALAAAAAVQARLWGDELALYARTLAVTDGNWAIRNNLGLALQARGRHDEAIAQFREALRVRPGYLDAWNNLGVSLGKLGRFDEAVAAHRAALRVDPRSVTSLYSLGGALTAAGDPAQALPPLRAALEIQPDSPGALYNLGNALAALGRFDEAAAQYRGVLDADPAHADARLNLGNALDAAGRADEAAAQYRALAALRPESFEARFNLANLLARRGDLAGAAALYRDALAIRPGQREAAENLAAVLRRLERN
jgi:tetratricopeptide (TPR) repeat protein